MMQNLADLTHFISGTPQFRVAESTDERALTHIWYAQHHLNADLTGIPTAKSEDKTITTLDAVRTLAEGDVVFSLISGMAAIVGYAHTGYVQTQNYIKLSPNKQLNPQFLIFLLNESRNIKRQWAAGLQGSSVLKYTLAQLKTLQIDALPSINKQQIIGNIYLMQQRRQALKQRAATLETQIITHLIEGAAHHE